MYFRVQHASIDESSGSARGFTFCGILGDLPLLISMLAGDKSISEERRPILVIHVPLVGNGRVTEVKRKQVRVVSCMLLITPLDGINIMLPPPLRG